MTLANDRDAGDLWTLRLPLSSILASGKKSPDTEPLDKGGRLPAVTETVGREVALSDLAPVIREAVSDAWQRSDYPAAV